MADLRSAAAEADRRAEEEAAAPRDGRSGSVSGVPARPAFLQLLDARRASAARSSISSAPSISIRPTRRRTPGSATPSAACRTTASIAPSEGFPRARGGGAEGDRARSGARRRARHAGAGQPVLPVELGGRRTAVHAIDRAEPVARQRPRVPRADAGHVRPPRRSDRRGAQTARQLDPLVAARQHERRLGALLRRPLRGGDRRAAQARARCSAAESRDEAGSVIIVALRAARAGSRRRRSWRRQPSALASRSTARRCCRPGAEGGAARLLGGAAGRAGSFADAPAADPLQLRRRARATRSPRRSGRTPRERSSSSSTARRSSSPSIRRWRRSHGHAGFEALLTRIGVPRSPMASAPHTASTIIGTGTPRVAARRTTEPCSCSTSIRFPCDRSISSDDRIVPGIAST